MGMSIAGLASTLVWSPLDLSYWYVRWHSLSPSLFPSIHLTCWLQLSLAIYRTGEHSMQTSEIYYVDLFQHTANMRESKWIGVHTLLVQSAATFDTSTDTPTNAYIGADATDKLQCTRRYQERQVLFFSYRIKCEAFFHCNSGSFCLLLPSYASDWCWEICFGNYSIVVVSCYWLPKFVRPLFSDI